MRDVGTKGSARSQALRMFRRSLRCMPPRRPRCLLHRQTDPCRHRNALKKFVSAVKIRKCCRGRHWPFSPHTSRHIRASAQRTGASNVSHVSSSQSRLVRKLGAVWLVAQRQQRPHSRVRSAVHRPPRRPLGSRNSSRRPDTCGRTTFALRARASGGAPERCKASGDSRPSSSSANDVGSTQLLVRGVHPHPRIGIVLRGNFARGGETGQQSSPRSAVPRPVVAEPVSTRPRLPVVASGSLASTQTRQRSHPASRPSRSAEAAQEPSASCAARKNWNPRSTISRGMRRVIPSRLQRRNRPTRGLHPALDPG